MFGIESLLLVGALLVLVSIAVMKYSENFGLPTLLLFLVVGMLAGSEGPGGIYFDDAKLAQSIGIVCLIFILFAAGLDTQWSRVRPVLRPAISLSTLGVLVTALLVGIFSIVVLNFSYLEGFLLGSIVSSTDAAAVFSVLRSQKLSLKNKLKPLLELESGSNDPMAVFLTIGFISLLKNPDQSFLKILLMFFFQMGLGAGLGYGFGKAMAFLMNRLKFNHEGIYPVFTIAFACLIYGAVTLIGGSGFLAIYIAGIIVGNSEIVQKRSLIRFFDGLAWLSQMTMFITLGLLVFPSHLLAVTSTGLMISIFLMFIARPLSIYVSLLFSKFNWREKAFASWVGLRGAVPIILATFPLLAQLRNAEPMFNLVFFIVLTSALFQGWTLPLAAKILKVDAPLEIGKRSPIEFAPDPKTNTDLLDFIVPYNSSIVGKSIVEIELPKDSLIIFIVRNEQFIVPSGGTILEGGDVLQVLGNRESFKEIQNKFSREE